jgi:hypothetical protein
MHELVEAMANMKESEALAIVDRMLTEEKIRPRCSTFPQKPCRWWEDVNRRE